MVPTITCLALSLLAAGFETEAYPNAGLLIEAAELAEPEKARAFRILDARPSSQYRAGHIPGAVSVDPSTWSREFGTGQDRDRWASRLGTLGIGTDQPVVVYGDASTSDPARVWWILRYWGVKDVRLLNGGWQAWQAAGGPVSTEEPKVRPIKAMLAPQSDRLATKEQVLDLLKTKKTQILDARSRAEHCGEARTAKRNGHIPGAIHLEWLQVIDPSTKRFKSVDELQEILRESGVRLDQPAVTYCQSGGRAAVLAFTLELLGAKDVRNYYRSWSEWGNAADTPVARPEEGK